jgi:hypothetical protein
MAYLTDTNEAWQCSIWLPGESTYNESRDYRHERYTAHVSDPGWRKRLETFLEERFEFLQGAMVLRQTLEGYQRVEFDKPEGYWI